ncbi:hypothetical protein GGI12_005036 [Dipsacomyces acuminosporus]|nr:hypothetical protein GGI12_005036 [Dipsacomyces acuminosporus]
MEFSHRPAHSNLPGAHGPMSASPAHYQYSTDSQPANHYATSPYAHHQHQASLGAPTSVSEAYPITAPRRLPSVSELLTPHDTQQVAGYAPQLMQIDHQQQQQQQQQQSTAAGYSNSSYAVVDSQKPFGIDVPGSYSSQTSAEYAGYHRNSESASSVSSQSTLVDSHLSAHPSHTYKQYQQHSTEAGRSMYEEDVFTAASILMSLRTCKMPC